jgi:hypothetical protein
MNAQLISRYQPGGDIYAQISAQYGSAGADTVAAAALTGDENAINDALVRVRYGSPLNDSTTSIFVDQITTDPTAAPLDALNKQLGNITKNIFGNPFVLVGVVAIAVGAFFYLKKK